MTRSGRRRENRGGETAGPSTSVAGASGSRQKLSTNNAVTYMQAVKDLLQDHREKHDRFSDLMEDFKAEKIDLVESIVRAKELLEGHPTLIRGFNALLALTDDKPEWTSNHEQSKSFLDKFWERFQYDQDVYSSFALLMLVYRSELMSVTDMYQEAATVFDGHPDLLVEFTISLPGFLADSEPLRVNCPHNAEKIEDLGWNTYLASSVDKSTLRSVFSQEFKFCKKVKERLCNSHEYRTFLEGLNNYSIGTISKAELQNLIVNLLGQHPDLMMKFNGFLEHCEQIAIGFMAGLISQNCSVEDVPGSSSSGSGSVGKTKDVKSHTSPCGNQLCIVCYSRTFNNQD